MSSNSIIKQTKLKQWASLFADQKSSGLSVIDWCRQNNISRDQFFYWKRKLKDELVTNALPDIVPISLPSAPDSVSPILSPSPQTKDNRATCTSCPTFTTGSCARVYINGMTVEFDASVPESLISNVVKAVRHV